jgi:predicted transcriptional regulator
MIAPSSLKTGENTQPILSDPAKLRVEEVMTSNPLTLSGYATIEQTARMMMKEIIGGVIVEESRLVAILTRTDILQRFLSTRRIHET